MAESSMMDSGREPATSDADLIREIETGFWNFPELPGRMEHLAIPGLLGRVTNTAHPMANVVGAATLTDENADAAIAQVVGLVEERHIAFGWVVGSTSSPAGLQERLTAAGFVPVFTLAGMATRDLHVAIPPAPGITVRRVTADDRDAAIEIMALSFQLPPDAAALFTDAVLDPRAADISSGYIACDAATEHPIAFAAATYSPRASDVLLLGGAATHPDHRGRGAYRALVARRFADAVDRGCSAAVIQAFRTTSAPICARIGLAEICSLDVYVRPPYGSTIATGSDPQTP